MDRQYDRAPYCCTVGSWSIGARASGWRLYAFANAFWMFFFSVLPFLLTSFGSNSNGQEHPRHSAPWDLLRHPGLSAAVRRILSSGPNRNADALEERGGYPLESRTSSRPIRDRSTRF